MDLLTAPGLLSTHSWNRSTPAIACVSMRISHALEDDGFSINSSKCIQWRQIGSTVAAGRSRRGEAILCRCGGPFRSRGGREDSYRETVSQGARRDGMSAREAARHVGVSRKNVKKMPEFSVPPGYRRTAPVRRPKLDGFTALIDEWLRGDVDEPSKQRHTAKRIIERHRNEHSFTGGYTIVTDNVRELRRRRREWTITELNQHNKYSYSPQDARAPRRTAVWSAFGSVLGSGARAAGLGYGAARAAARGSRGHRV